MKRFLALTLLALTLFALCIQAARWQFDRYETRHARNALIAANIAQPSISEGDLAKLDSNEIAWREIMISGRFQPANEILVRNRYFQERYGLAVVTLFKSESGKNYWVDRGWVAPGPDALTPPKTIPVDGSLITIRARVRLEDIENQIGGSVFALPNSTGESKLQSWNRQDSITTEAVYFDLITSSNAAFTPQAPTALPVLSDGPHLAYALQWLLFAGFVLVGYGLVLREDRRAQSVNA